MTTISAETSFADITTSNGYGSTSYPLPVELILYIFDIAAASSAASERATLLVCSWAHAAIAKRLFSTLVVRSNSLSKGLFPKAIAPFVRNLWIDQIDREPLAKTVLSSTIVHLESLAIAESLIADMWDAIKQQECTGTGQLPRFSCRSLFVTSRDASAARSWTQLCETDVGRSFLSGITHIRFAHLGIAFPALWNPARVPPASVLPNLTHVAFPGLDRLMFDAFMYKDGIRNVVRTIPPYIYPVSDLFALKLYIDSRQLTQPTQPINSKMIYVALCNESLLSQSERMGTSHRRGDLFDPMFWKQEAKGGISVWDSAVSLDSILTKWFSHTGAASAVYHIPIS